MSDSQACCAHCKVILKHTDHPDGTRSDYWECADGCGQRFLPCPTSPAINTHKLPVLFDAWCIVGIYDGPPLRWKD
jgi:hypothetical protein